MCFWWCLTALSRTQMWLILNGIRAAALLEILGIELCIWMTLFDGGYVCSLKEHEWSHFKCRYLRWTLSNLESRCTVLYLCIVPWVTTARLSVGKTGVARSRGQCSPEVVYNCTSCGIPQFLYIIHSWLCLRKLSSGVTCYKGVVPINGISYIFCYFPFSKRMCLFYLRDGLDGFKSFVMVALTLATASISYAPIHYALSFLNFPLHTAYNRSISPRTFKIFCTVLLLYLFMLLILLSLMCELMCTFVSYCPSYM